MALRTMTVRHAEKVWDEYLDRLGKASSAIECAERANFKNGFYSPEPQVREARVQLQAVLDMLPQVELALEVLG